MLWVATLFDHVGRGLVLRPDLDELGFVHVTFAEVGAEAALSVLYCDHDVLL
jgi:hypothetical protein